MSSSEEQESRVDSMVAKALEAVKDPFLRKIGERFQRDPNQMLRLSEILGFSNEEEKNTKALVWLKKNEPAKYEAVLQTSEAKTKKRRKKMKTVWGRTHLVRELKKLFERTSGCRLSMSENVYGFECFPNLFSAIMGACGSGPGPNGIACIKPKGENAFRDGCYADLIIYVYDEFYLEKIRKFARAYERKTGKKAEVHREY